MHQNGYAVEVACSAVALEAGANAVLDDNSEFNGYIFEQACNAELSGG
jgi:hypothetical protein